MKMMSLSSVEEKPKIDCSVSGYRWVFNECSDREVTALMQRHSVPEALARVLASRGVSAELAGDYLTPSIKNSLPDPSHLLDMDKAAKRVAKAVMNGELIAIFGDYDVDGATSASLLKRFFNMAGGESMIYIPDRVAEGYGPNSEAITQLWERGARVLITVDCGTVSYEPLDVAANLGFDTIVVDHHIGGDKNPRALAVINPNRLDENTEYTHLAAVGVSFLLAVAANRELRSAGWYETRPEPDLIKLLDLVALGTICDVMPIHGINRAFVAQGLKIMASRGNMGLAALADISGMSEKPGVYHLGFVLGPRINAGGRIGEASLGARLLSTSDPLEAQEIAKQLDKLNAERRAIESLVEEEALSIVAREGTDRAILLVSGHGWHPGVIGIVASRLKEKFNKPAAVIAFQNGIGKASGRSVAGVDLGAAIASARESGLLVNGGGHAMAAGFTVTEENFPKLSAFLEERLSARGESFEKILKFDGSVSMAGLNTGLAGAVEKAGPFGAGNPEPRFLLAGARIVNVDVVGGSHVRCVLDNNGFGGPRHFALAFRSLSTPLGDFLLASPGRPVHLAVRLRLSNWQGRERVEIQVDDAAIA